MRDSLFFDELLGLATGMVGNVGKSYGLWSLLEWRSVVGLGVGQCVSDYNVVERGREGQRRELTR